MAASQASGPSCPPTRACHGAEGLIARHLVMPRLLGETEAILRLIATELGAETHVNLVAQYYLAGRTSEFPAIDRHLYRDEFERRCTWPTSLGCGRLDQQPRSADKARGGVKGAHQWRAARRASIPRNCCVVRSSSSPLPQSRITP
jgi:hypothetical protein